MAMNPSIIDVLPNECWLYVFSFIAIEDLLQVKQVSKKCEELVLFFWETLDTIDLLHHPQLNKHFCEMLECCGDILEIVTFPLSRHDTAISDILEYCFELRQVVVSFEDHEDEIDRYRSLSALFKQNPHLDIVILSNVGKNFHEHCDCLLELPETLRYLGLWVFRPNQIYEPMLRLPFTYFKNCDPVLSRFRNLQVLKLYGFTMDITEITAIENMRDLLTLEIYFTWKLENDQPPYSIITITQLTKLVHLSLFFVDVFDDGWFANLAANCKNLEFLQLKCCPLEDADISKLGELKNLEWIRLEHLRDGIDGQGFVNLKNLKIFTCTGNPYVGDSSIIKLLEVAPNLQFIDLTLSGVTSRVIEFANTITKKRTNNVMLHIRIDSKHFDAYVTGMTRLKQKYISPYLCVDKVYISE